MDLFAGTRKKNLDRVAPLPVRMRPRNLDVLWREIENLIVVVDIL